MMNTMDPQASPPAERDVCAYCGARPLRGVDGRILSWAVGYGVRTNDHEHETLRGDR